MKSTSSSSRLTPHQKAMVRTSIGVYLRVRSITPGVDLLLTDMFRDFFQSDHLDERLVPDREERDKKGNHPLYERVRRFYMGKVDRPNAILVESLRNFLISEAVLNPDELAVSDLAERDFLVLHNCLGGKGGETKKRLSSIEGTFTCKKRIRDSETTFALQFSGTENGTYIDVEEIVSRRFFNNFSEYQKSRYGFGLILKHNRLLQLQLQDADGRVSYLEALLTRETCDEVLLLRQEAQIEQRDPGPDYGPIDHLLHLFNRDDDGS